EPGLMGLGPVEAIRGLLEPHGLRDADIDLYEINEAFAGQVLGVLRQLDLDASRVNVNGGAIALGHPIGASGCRILVTLTHEMRRRNARRGVAALCVGGGMGIAALVESADLEAGKGRI
ncbi:MAG: acetyl-CoA C-acetyltransferase, partial [Chloroflexota bacterium]|nr:acetyl-CoA C-acetyltransferase [Chloroflexota bacterium]